MNFVEGAYRLTELQNFQDLHVFHVFPQLARLCRDVALQQLSIYANQELKCPFGQSVLNTGLKSRTLITAGERSVA
ncbi:MAG: hypothetical protein LBG92_06085 [Prevotellaceae bacterium]|nr:hypothetical protein [Prevotellaceae bacterium]